MSTSWRATKNSRLYKRLVYDLQVAQDVTACQESDALSSSVRIITDAASGGTPWTKMQKVIDEEIAELQRAVASDHELQRSIRQMEASFYNRMERAGGFEGKADQLNAWLFHEHRRPGLLQRGSRALPRSFAVRHPARPPSRFTGHGRRVEGRGAAYEK